MFSHPNARARGWAARDAIRSTRRSLDRPGWCSRQPADPHPAGEVTGGAVRQFFLVDCCSPVRGGDGARAVGAIDDDDDVGFAGSGPPRISPPGERSELGVIDNDRQILQHLRWQRSPSFSTLARARGSETAVAAMPSDPTRPARSAWLVQLAAGPQDSMVRSPAAPSPVLFSGLLFTGSGRRWSSGGRGDR